jgi:hypothetical protein
MRQFGIIRNAALYEGYSPATAEKFRELWKKAGGAEIGRTIKQEIVERSLFD